MNLKCIALSMLLLPVAGIAANPFDAPLKTRHVELKADPQNPQVKRRISCFYYRSIVVKEVDYGEVGAERLALLPVLAGNATPCRDGKETYEYEIPTDRWSGYFRGAKGDYAFFDAPDGTNGGLGFMVLRIVDRKPLFEDTAQHGIQAIDILDKGLKLRYQRVYQGNCSAISGGASCRAALSQETGVADASLSSCEPGYAAAKQTMAKGRCAAQAARQPAGCLSTELANLDQQHWNEAPTVIVYDVEVILGTGAPIITRRSDALACRPSD